MYTLAPNSSSISYLTFTHSRKCIFVAVIRVVSGVDWDQFAFIHYQQSLCINVHISPKWADYRLRRQNNLSTLHEVKFMRTYVKKLQIKWNHRHPWQLLLQVMNSKRAKWSTDALLIWKWWNWSFVSRCFSWSFMQVSGVKVVNNELDGSSLPSWKIYQC